MRVIALRSLAGLFALSWLVLPGFGLIDLSVTWDSDWPQVLEAGWGLFFTVLVGVAFWLVAIRPRVSTPAVAQLFVAAGALTVSAVLAREPRLLALSVAVALETAIVMRVPQRVRLDRSELASQVSKPLLLIASLGAVPWVVYAFRMCSLNRQERGDSDVTLGIDHYSVQGAVGLAIAALAVITAVWPGGRRFVGCCTGVVSAYLGLVSFAWPDAAGGFGRAWSAAAIVWGIAFVALALASPAEAGHAGS